MWQYIETRRDVPAHRWVRPTGSLASFLVGVSVVLSMLIVADGAGASHSVLGPTNVAGGQMGLDWTYTPGTGGDDCFKNFSGAVGSVEYRIGWNCMVIGEGVHWAEQRRYGQHDTTNAHLNSIQGAQGVTNTKLESLLSYAFQHDADLNAIRTAVEETRDEAELQTAALVDIKTNLSDGIRAHGATDADAVPVSDETQQEATTAGANAVHADLWFLIGLAAASLGSYALYRVVMPRA